MFKIKKIIFISYAILLWGILNAYGQSIEELRWKNRVVLLRTSDTSNHIYKMQKDAFERAFSDLIDRKIILCLVNLEKEANCFSNEHKQLAITRPQLPVKKTIYDLILIGLDGQIKHSHMN